MSDLISIISAHNVGEIARDAVLVGAGVAIDKPSDGPGFFAVVFLVIAAAIGFYLLKGMFRKK